MSEQRVSVGKSFALSIAHRLPNYDGPCVNIHGHTYKLELEFFGVPNWGDDDMLIDFHQIDDLVHHKAPYGAENLSIMSLDHTLVVSSEDPISDSVGGIARVIKLDNSSPTSEALLLFIANRIRAAVRSKPELRQRISTVTITLWESERTFARLCTQTL